MANYNKRNLLERFMEKVIPVTESGCWLWLAATDTRGYGNFYMEGKLWKAHRASMVIHGVAINDDQYACHKCDTPSCVNPLHMFAGSAKDNHNDMREKGRHKYPNNKGIRNGRAKLTEDNVRHILASDESTTDLARHYGVTYQAIWQVRNGTHWADVA